MNLINGHVTKVLEKTKFIAPEDWGSSAGTVYDIFVVEYWDDGGQQKEPTQLWFLESEHKNVDVGYVFQH